jgi:hypothetical protein
LSYVGPVTTQTSSAGKFDPNVHSPQVIRLAEALGWDHIPVMTEEEEREADRRLAEALEDARTFYGRSDGSP